MNDIEIINHYIDLFGKTKTAITPIILIDASRFLSDKNKKIIKKDRGVFINYYRNFVSTTDTTNQLKCTIYRASDFISIDIKIYYTKENFINTAITLEDSHTNKFVLVYKDIISNSSIIYKNFYSDIHNNKNRFFRFIINNFYVKRMPSIISTIMKYHFKSLKNIFFPNN